MFASHFSSVYLSAYSVTVIEFLNIPFFDLPNNASFSFDNGLFKFYHYLIKLGKLYHNFNCYRPLISRVGHLVHCRIFWGAEQ